METVSNSASEEISTGGNAENTDTFQKVKSKKTSKRKRDQGEVEMESEDAVALKRPQFPPISGDRLKVTDNHSVLLKLIHILILHDVACWNNVNR